MNQPEIILGVTGSIAAYKAADLVRRLRERGYAVHCVMSEEAKQFITPLTLQGVSGHPVFSELFGASEAAVAHTTLADRAQLVLVAPATANVLAKLAYGHADDAVTCTVLATKAPVLLAPAMNVHMYRHPMVQENLKRLRRLGYHVVGPEVGSLACGYEAIGHLAEVEHIVQAALQLARPSGGPVLASSVDGTRPVRRPSRRRVMPRRPLAPARARHRAGSARARARR